MFIFTRNSATNSFLFNHFVSICFNDILTNCSWLHQVKWWFKNCWKYRNCCIENIFHMSKKYETKSFSKSSFMLNYDETCHRNHVFSISKLYLAVIISLPDMFPRDWKFSSPLTAYVSGYVLRNVSSSIFSETKEKKLCKGKKFS